MRNENLEKKRKALDIKLIVVIIILLTTLALGALAVNIYLLVRMTTATTARPGNVESTDRDKLFRENVLLAVSCSY